MTARAIAIAFVLWASACLSTTTDPNAGRALELPPSQDAASEGGSDSGADAPVDSSPPPPIVDAGGGRG